MWEDTNLNSTHTDTVLDGSCRKAFSMLEVMFVIIILGIVSSIGAEVIARVYESYIIQRAQHRAAVKTELAALQIANRLSAVIPGTQKRIRVSDSGYESLESSFTGSGDDYKGLKWVGSDMDSFSTAATPGWSGLCDVNASVALKPTLDILTPGSNLDLAASVMTNLGADFSVFLPSLYFPYDDNAYVIGGYDSAASTLRFVSVGGSPIPTLIQEHYKLAWTSYALVVEDNSEGGKDLNLYHNFRPTPDEAYTNGTRSLLLHNVSTFRLKGAGSTLRFKVCKHERISKDVNITVCKEKAVF